MSSIQWTDVTDNPIHLVKGDGKNGGHWCKKISPGCANCYAETKNQSNFFSWASHRLYHGEPPKNLTLNRALIQSWARMRLSKRHFVCSMTDWAGEWVPREWQFELLDAMVRAPKQTFQLLTKRPHIALNSIQQYCQLRGIEKLSSNIWIGVSVENQKCADERICILSKIPSRVRFLSVEPLLEEVQLRLLGIHWVIVGGESGSYVRLCQVEWIQSVVSQCQESEVPVFVKQLGSFSNTTNNRLTLDDYLSGNYRNDPKRGDMAKFPKHLQVREFPTEV